MNASKSEKFVKLMTGPMGRVGRIILGLLILTLGQLVVRGTPGMVMSAVALVPMGGGIFDYCLIARAMGYPLSGSGARAELAARELARSKRVMPADGR